jgi:hypothetical protein
MNGPRRHHESVATLSVWAHMERRSGNHQLPPALHGSPDRTHGQVEVMRPRAEAKVIENPAVEYREMSSVPNRWYRAYSIGPNPRTIKRHFGTLDDAQHLRVPDDPLHLQMMYYSRKGNETILNWETLTIVEDVVGESTIPSRSVTSRLQ